MTLNFDELTILASLTTIDATFFLDSDETDGLLGEEIINFKRLVLKQQLQDQGEGSQTVVLSSHFYSKAQQPGRSVNSGRRWLQRAGAEDLSRVEVVLMPIHFGVHWVVFMIDLRSQLLRWFDSYTSYTNKYYDGIPEKVSREVATFLAAIYKDTLADCQRYHFPEWRLVKESCPQQNEGSIECEIFALGFLESLCFGRRLVSFTEKQAKRRREMLEKEIKSHKQ